MANEVIRIYIKKKHKNEWWDFDDQSFKAYDNVSKKFKKLAEYPDQPGLWHTDIDMGTHTGAITVVPRNADSGLIAGDVKHFYVIDGNNATQIARDRTLIDEDFGGNDNLRYMDGDSNPVDGADIRVYTKQDYDAGNVDEAIGVTTTDGTGRWTNPIPVARGQTYTVHFHKPHHNGPTTVNITVA